MTQNIAQYGVLAHYPQPNRSEHVNIGIVVFLGNGTVRVHFGQDLKKLRAVDPSVKLETVRSWETGLPRLLAGQSVEEATEFLQHFGQWKLSAKLGRFSFNDDAEYLVRITTALHSLVAPPARGQRERNEGSHLHADLKSAFSAKGWIGNDITNHEIVERYPLGPMTTAEFALQNGRLHVIESLDLRTSNPSAKRVDARSKALILDSARRSVRAPNEYVGYAVLAGVDSPLHKDARALMRDYCDNVLTWESAMEMDDLMRRLGEATKKPGLSMPLAD
jgi:hypothetical protein